MPRDCRRSVAVPADSTSGFSPAPQPLIFTLADRPCGMAACPGRATRAVPPSGEHALAVWRRPGAKALWSARGEWCEPAGVNPLILNGQWNIYKVQSSPAKLSGVLSRPIMSAYCTRFRENFRLPDTTPPVPRGRGARGSHLPAHVGRGAGNSSQSHKLGAEPDLSIWRRAARSFGFAAV